MDFDFSSSKRQWLRTSIATALVAIGAASTSASAWAENFPSKPITLVVPFAPGGSSDVLARKVAEGLSQVLGQAVVVDNKGGASGAIGASHVARSTPDGHTLLLAHTTNTLILPLLKKDLGYSPSADLQPITLIGQVPQALVVPANGPRSVQELVQQAQSQPGQLTYSSGGVATPPHLTGELFRQQAHIDINHVPFSGSTPSIVNLIGGHVNAAFQNVDSVLQHVRAGKLQALAIASDQRAASLPNVPTLQELGIDGVVNKTWFGLAAPKSTPQPVIAKLEAAAQKVLSSPEFQQFLHDNLTEPTPLGQAAFTHFLQQEQQRWSAILRKANISLQG